MIMDIHNIDFINDPERHRLSQMRLELYIELLTVKISLRAVAGCDSRHNYDRLA